MDGQDDTVSLEALLQMWDGEEVILRRDQPTGATIIIAVHSTRLGGSAGGGTRMKTYPSIADAVRDAQRLAEGMTYKFAAAGLARGGGKAVIAIPPDLDEEARDDLLRRYGALIRQLGGIYSTGPDVGTSSRDMDIIAETGGPYVFGRTQDHGGVGDSGPATAAGVLAGIQATCAHLFGSDALTGRRVVVQGVGKVGFPLLRLLREESAELVCSDVDAAGTERARTELGCEVVAPDAVYDAACDIFSPCALGAILNDETIPRLRCRAVAGSANNQLATPADAERLRGRNILYAPDFVVNSGGAIYLLGRELLGWTEEEALERIVLSVRTTLAQVFALAEAEGITTNVAAERLARQRIAEGATAAGGE
ncbi:MAG TPA: Glu/Leu/Phe/Val dehydrogenase dimerization domain-containing protein [Ktedonobacterales bacterium]|nr:Glu/Leu/Phe/Val dehydrogenase dimerization domain-containing protein [Ktedonobacterales bacterium]